jgi:peptidoglycan glycosyltransferase
MGRRIRWLGVVMVVALGLIVIQLVNIQLVKAKALQTSPYNPRVSGQQYHNPRGTIFAADGTVLAKSVPVTPTASYPYHYMRQYPDGPLFSGIVGYDSPIFYGRTGIEEEYNSDLGVHQQAPQTLSQLLFRQKLPVTTDDVTLTVEPKLQQQVWDALTTLPPGANKDGAVVVLDPKTGAVLAMVSNPTFDNNAMASESLSAEKLAYLSYTTKDAEGFLPLRPIATEEFFFPGSTMKVVTSTSVYNLKPSLANFNYPVAPCQTFSDAPLNPLCNDGSSPATAVPCGGMMTIMLPQSCDPGYGELGVQVGVETLRQQAFLFGYNTVPPIDLPDVIASKVTPLPSNAQRLQADTAIGQQTVETTALQNAMVAEGIANGGVMMTPHLMSQIRDSKGNIVTTYAPQPRPRSASTLATQAVTSLMEGVAQSPGVPFVPDATAGGIFPPYLCAAVKTGTAQTGLSLNHDWMIGFAPANNPQVAVAVVVPFQAQASDGASVAGPIMRAVLEAALPQGSVSQPCSVPAPPVTDFTTAPAIPPAPHP